VVVEDFSKIFHESSTSIKILTRTSDTLLEDLSTCMKIFRYFIPVVFYVNMGGWVRRNTTVVASYFYWIDDGYMFRPYSAIFRSN